jgi:hypothetical protein
VTLGSRYVAGVAAVGLAGLVVATLVPAAWRAGVLWGLAVGLLLQAPLGWWTLRAVGTERFFTVWGLGMLTRFGVLLVAAVALTAVPGPLAAPMLTTMVATLVALLLVEGVAAMLEHSREHER